MIIVVWLSESAVSKHQFRTKINKSVPATLICFKAGHGTNGATTVLLEILKPWGYNNFLNRNSQKEIHNADYYSVRQTVEM